MKVVMPDAPEQILEWRARTGADRWDEMWEGVLHMPPVPNRSHQELQGELHGWLRSHWAKPGGNKVYPPINVASVGGWPSNYRIPDLVLLKPEAFDIDRNEYFEGPPTAVVEIRSPGDESYEKLPFYADLGVPEVWVIDRDSRLPEVYVLQAGEYQLQAPDADGWVRSPATAVRLCCLSGQKLGVQMADDDATRRTLPEE